MRQSGEGEFNREARGQEPERAHREGIQGLFPASDEGRARDVRRRLSSIGRALETGGQMTSEQ